ncbi:hypothetical protein GCM10009741_04620 [Kribbella lupini]|uniref:Uncharacterized protein n=1 Tax=Kribbella lupini TaxID=291602 RepID=A0ABN2A3G5_9ACTN
MSASGDPAAGNVPAAATAVAPAAVATSNVRRVIGVTGMAELRNGSAGWIPANPSGARRT